MTSLEETEDSLPPAEDGHDDWAAAFAAVELLAAKLREAAATGRRFTVRQRGGERELEPEDGPDGRKWRRAEFDGSWEMVVRVEAAKPPAPT